MSDTEAVRQELLERLFSAFNSHDSAAIAACMTQDVVFYAAAGPDTHGKRFIGAAEVRAAFERTWADMLDVKWECKRHAVFGDRALSEWLFRGTVSGGWQIEVEGCDIFRFRDNLICEKSAFRKERALHQQIAGR